MTSNDVVKRISSKGQISTIKNIINNTIEMILEEDFNNIPLKDGDTVHDTSPCCIVKKRIEARFIK